MTLTATGADVELLPVGCEATTVLGVGRVVNCSGPLSDISRIQAPLLRQLDCGDARADPLKSPQCQPISHDRRDADDSRSGSNQRQPEDGMEALGLLRRRARLFAPQPRITLRLVAIYLSVVRCGGLHCGAGDRLARGGKRDLPGARAAFARALAIDEKAFGAEHPRALQLRKRLSDLNRLSGG
jgi:hypothetical protein